MSQANPADSAPQQPPQASSTVHILSLLLRLRQCCCHLSLLQKVFSRLWHGKLSGCWSETRSWVHKKSDLVLPVQTLDSSELQGDGIVLSLEEQLSAMSITSSPSTSGPDPKATVSLNGTRFPSHLFEDTSLSTKVSRSHSFRWLSTDARAEISVMSLTSSKTMY